MHIYESSSICWKKFLPYCCLYFHLSQTKHGVFLYDKQLTRKKKAQMIAGGFHAYISEEYKNVNTSEELTSVSFFLPNEDLHSGYNRIPGGSSAERKSFLKSFRKAIWTSISMAFSLFSSTAFAIIFLYVDLNTTDLCIEW